MLKKKKKGILQKIKKHNINMIEAIKQKTCLETCDYQPLPYVRNLIKPHDV